eukprot:458751_1
MSHSETVDKQDVKLLKRYLDELSAKQFKELREICNKAKVAKGIYVAKMMVKELMKYYKKNPIVMLDQIIFLYYKSIKPNIRRRDYYDQDQNGKFLQFVITKNLKYNQQKNINDFLDKCINFDPAFPIHEHIKKLIKKRMSKSKMLFYLF